MKDTESAAVSRVARMKRWRQVDAQLVVDVWRRSGLPLAEWARRRRIDAKRLARWAATLETAGEPSTIAFHPVQLAPANEKPRNNPTTVEPPAPGGLIEIVLPCGTVVRVPAKVDAEHLRCVLEVLEAVPC